MLLVSLFLIVSFKVGAQGQQVCEDRTKDVCAQWNSKMCAFRWKEMSRDCKHTCGMCGTKNNNVDRDSRCKSWKEFSYCQPNQSYCRAVVRRCPYTCNFNTDTHCTVKPTPKPTACRDKATSCDADNCSVKPDKMAAECLETCQMCGSKNTSFDKDARCNKWYRDGYCRPTSKFCRGVVKKCPYSCPYDRNQHCKS